MNIFAVDNDPYKAAQNLCDKHVVKMVLETTQILCTVANEKGFNSPYKSTHKNHPCVLWAKLSPFNWSWLLVHGIALCNEYSARYGKVHKCEEILYMLDDKFFTIWDTADMSTKDYTYHTPFEQCMPDEYRGADPIAAYRAYYNGDKKGFATWKAPGKKPDWFTS